MTPLHTVFPASVFAALVLFTATGRARPQASAVDGAEASSQREARLHFEDAARLYRNGDERGALVEFRKAYDAKPEARVLLNIAHIEAGAGDSANAYRDYERLLATWEASIPVSRRDEARRALRELAPRVAWIAIASEGPGVAIEIDGAPQGEAPARIVVAPGRHHVVLQHEGRRVVDDVVDVEAGTTRTEHVDLVRVEAAAPAPPATPAARVQPSPPMPHARAEPSAAQPSLTPAWIAWGTTGALAVAAATTGVLAFRHAEDYAKAQATYGVTRSELEGAQAPARSFSIAALALTGASVVSGGLATYLTLVATGRETKGPAVGGSRAGTRIALGPTSMAIVGVFP